MAEAVYVTQPEDVLDAITYKHYQGRYGAFEAVLAANPGLAEYGSVLPGGLTVVLPELPEPEDPNVYTLW